MNSLRNNTLFRDIEDTVFREQILPHCKQRSVKKGNYLLTPQEKLDYFSVILQGSIHTLHLFSDGNYTIMEVLEQGEIYGSDLIATSSRSSPYYALAARDTDLAMFPGDLIMTPGYISEELRQLLLFRLLHLVANRNMQKEYRLAILSQKGLRERILTYLQMQSQKRKTNCFRIPFSREDLASFLCVNRSALSHELSKMQRDGLIRFHKNEFTLLKPF